MHLQIAVYPALWKREDAYNYTYIYIVQGLFGRGFVANNGRTCSVRAHLSDVCLCVCGCRLLNRRWSTPLRTAPRLRHRVSPDPGLLLLAARCVLSECGVCLQCCESLLSLYGGKKQCSVYGVRYICICTYVRAWYDL